MSNVINKTTGQYLQSVNTPDYKTDEWIINPSKADITKYTPEPIVVDPKIMQREQLIEEKKRFIAIEALKVDGLLDIKGELK